MFRIVYVTYPKQQPTRSIHIAVYVTEMYQVKSVFLGHCGNIHIQNNVLTKCDIVTVLYRRNL